MHRKIHGYYKRGQSTFIFADSMDDYCLKIGYASAVAAFDDLPAGVREYVHMSHDKSNPIFYMHVGLVAAPHDVLFVDTGEGDEKNPHIIMNMNIEEATVVMLKGRYWVG